MLKINPGFRGHLIHRYLSGASHLKKIGFYAFAVQNEHLHVPTCPGESLLVVLKGSVSIQSGNTVFSSVGKRKDVFDGQAFGVFIPAGLKTTIYSEDLAEIAVCYSLLPPKKKYDPQIIAPEKESVRRVGSGAFQRKVINILTSKHPGDFLLVGETISMPGKWSSYPPHKHDQDSSKENKMEELYYFRTEKSSSFGFINLYSPEKKTDRVYKIHHNDVVKIPFGYHPVSSPPDSRLYYLWVLSGTKRYLKYKEDPAFAYE